MTFDDGPDVDATPAVLDALDQAGARATFFVIASQVRRNLLLAREIHRRGHEMALHGYEHSRHDKLPSAHSRDDVMQGFAAIEEATGVRCRWYRPPFGRMTPAAADACRELEMTPVYWSAWGVDWESVPADRIAEIASAQLDDGAILLLHDSAEIRPQIERDADGRGHSPDRRAGAEARDFARVSRRGHVLMSGTPQRILLVANPGGHLLQMLALEGAWEGLDRRWVTLAAADSKSLLARGGRRLRIRSDRA